MSVVSALNSFNVTYSRDYKIGRMDLLSSLIIKYGYFKAFFLTLMSFNPHFLCQTASYPISQGKQKSSDENSLNFLPPPYKLSEE